MGVAQLTVQRSGWWMFRDAMAGLREFRTYGALRGGFGPVLFGRLPSELRGQVPDKGYVVYSYGTPIAWLSGGVWVCPDVKYSVSTTRHQGLIRTAVAALNNGA